MMNKVRNTMVASALAIALAALVMGGQPAVAEENGGSRLYPPGSTPLGASYSTWAERWGVFAFGTPVGENPFVHPKDCDDSVKVIDGAVFLTASGGGPLTVSCPIPANTPILVTPGGNDGVLSLNGDTPKAVRHFINEYVEQISAVRLSIDGARVDIDGFLTHTDGLFTVNLPKNNIVGMPAGPAQLYIAGWFAMVRGFGSGTHTIYAQDVLPDGTFASTTYHLEVK
jgi:hypothetical protein